MNVEIVKFPKTKVAVIEHVGSQAKENESVKQLIKWRIENKLPPSPKYKNYGVHYNDPNSVPENEYRVDLCLSIEEDVKPNDYGVITKFIPELRCAKVTHLGSLETMTAASFLYNEWLPSSGVKLAEFPVFFHYVNVGPDVKEDEMITDIYLPIL